MNGESATPEGDAPTDHGGPPDRDQRTSRPRRRDAFADAGRAMRQSIERAARTDLGERDRRVHAAVLSLTTSWSRLRDETSVRQVAALTFAIDRDAVLGWHRQRTAESLRKLARLGIIQYVAGRGRRGRCVVELPPAIEEASEISPMGETVDFPDRGTEEDALPRGVIEGGRVEEDALPPRGKTPYDSAGRRPAGVAPPRSKSEDFSEKAMRDGYEEQEQDALKARAVAHFARQGVARDDVIRAIDQLRAADIGDTVIDEAIGQSENAQARRLGYLVTVAKDFMAQRTRSYPTTADGIPVVAS